MAINDMPPDPCSHGPHHCRPLEGDYRVVNIKAASKGMNPCAATARSPQDCELQGSQQDSVSACPLSCPPTHTWGVALRQGRWRAEIPILLISPC